MTDRSPDIDVARLRGTLAAWFDGEVRQATVDLRRGPLRPSRARRGATRGFTAPAAGAILLVALVLAGISRLPSLVGPATEPTGSSGPSSPVTAPEPLTSIAPATTGVIEGRYGDGIPMRIDGEPVLRIPVLDAEAPMDDTSFLLGAWTVDWSGITVSCGISIETPPPIGPMRCNTRWLSDGPANHGHSPLFLDGWPTMPAGPVVVRVHRHDPRAQQCGPTLRDGCEATAVIEEVVWTGDDVTAAAPLGPVTVFARLSGADPTLSGAAITPVGRPLPEPLPSMTPPPRGSGEPPRLSGQLPRACELPRPPLSWSIAGASISYVAIFPSTAAREALDRTQGCFMIVPVDALFAHERIRVDNVVVEVLVDPNGGPTPAQAALIEAIRQTLEGPEG